jgi:SAM-dependent methyltransferase
MSIYGLLQKSFRSLIPKSWRDKLWEENSPLAPILSKFRSRIALVANHDELYDKYYYERVVEPEIIRSAPIIAESLVRDFNPQSVIDIGCGTGTLLLELKKRGVNTLGLEYSQAGLENCRVKGLSVQHFNIESGKAIAEKADLAISTEVAEHLPAKCADKYVDILTSISNTVIVTAATPGQGGLDHVNEQPNEYWIGKFSQRDFQYQKEFTMQLRKEWQEKNTTDWYYSNVMVFKRND